MAEKMVQRELSPLEDQTLNSALKQLTSNPDPASIREVFSKLKPEEAKLVKEWAEGLIKSKSAKQLSKLAKNAEIIRAVRREALLHFLKEKKSEMVRDEIDNVSRKTALQGYLQVKKAQHKKE